MSAIKKILTMPLRLSILALLMGMLMKFLEWPMATQLMLLSFISIGILYIIRFWKKPSRQFIDYIKLILVFFWTSNGVFQIMDFAYTIVFQVIIAISFITWFVMEGTAYFLYEDRKAKNTNTQLLWNLAIVAGTLSIIAGSLFKMLNWELAVPLILVGIAIIAAYVLKDVFIVDKIGKEDRNNEEYQL